MIRFGGDGVVLCNFILRRLLLKSLHKRRLVDHLLGRFAYP